LIERKSQIGAFFDRPALLGKHELVMQIAYMDPLTKAWDRMKLALFKPFALSTWFIVGFTAFLAGLLNGNTMLSFPNGNSGGTPRENFNLPDIRQVFQKVLEWIHAHPVFFMFIVIGIVIVIIISLLLAWLASRGAFMFLDNVVGNRAQVAAPWRQYKMQGNSLFLWRIGFGLICFLFSLPLIILVIYSLVPILRDHNAGKYLLSFVVSLLAFVLLCIVAGYVSLLTTNFVVPLMYKYNLKAVAAWSAFMPVLTSHFGSFVLYALFLLLLAIVTGIAIAIAGCLTCCCLFLFIWMPYIGSVVLLPVTYTYRAFSLEFLAQFGPEYALFPIPEPLSPEPTVPDPDPTPIFPA
jgi:hypothetical protein